MKAGIPSSLLVEAHGSFASATCVICGKHCPDMNKFWEDVENDLVPRCQLCKDEKNKGGLLKPDVVFFGESLPPNFSDKRAEDFKDCDLLIVIGTSLTVYPFAALVNDVSPFTPRLLFNKEAVGPFAKSAQYWIKYGEAIPKQIDKNAYRDVGCIGDIDTGVGLLAKMLGWEDALQKLSTE